MRRPGSETLEKNWKAEKGLVDEILAVRAKLRGPAGSTGSVEGTGSKAEEDDEAAAAPDIGARTERAELTTGS
jgi:type VI secretion system protein VasG